MRSRVAISLRKLRTWSRASRLEKRLCVELAFELARARWQVSFVPFRVYARHLGPPQAAVGHVAADQPEPDADTLRLLVAVQWLTTSLSELLPWRCTCLVQALAARRVLRRRGCRTNLYLGVRKSPDEMEAHAWLSYGRRMITGRNEALGFAPLALFKG